MRDCYLNISLIELYIHVNVTYNYNDILEKGHLIIIIIIV